MTAGHEIQAESPWWTYAIALSHQGLVVRFPTKSCLDIFVFCINFI
jgi:hypothetical protein